MKWIACIEGGPLQVNHAAVCVKDMIFSFGGCSAIENYNVRGPIYVFILNTSTFRWFPVNYKFNDAVPSQRYGHTTVAYGDKVYMWGGRKTGCNTVNCFDTNTLEWSIPSVSGDAPTAKEGHTACIIKNKMYIFGGYDYNWQQYTQDVHCFDLDTMHWSVLETKGQLPSNRTYHTAVAFGSRMYVYGGYALFHNQNDQPQEMYCPELYYLDIELAEWVLLCPNGFWPYERRSHTAWVYKGSMYIFGGYNRNTAMFFNDIHRFSFSDNMWQAMNFSGSVPKSRLCLASVLYKDKVYMFGGLSPIRRVYIRDFHIEYSGHDHIEETSDLNILDYAPTLKTLCIRCVVQNRLVQRWLPPSLIMDIRNMCVPNNITTFFSDRIYLLIRHTFQVTVPNP